VRSGSGGLPGDRPEAVRIKLLGGFSAGRRAGSLRKDGILRYMMRRIRRIFEVSPPSYRARVRALASVFALKGGSSRHKEGDADSKGGTSPKPSLARAFRQGFEWSKKWGPANEALADAAYGVSSADSSNPLEAYFDSHTEGRGIWKWRHYFEIYHRHFSKFIGQEVHLLEIGVYSGGSLDMWKQYFGPKCRVYGVDIEEVCKSYEDDSVKILIGDQADRNFWTLFKKEVPRLDIIIDDGGHRFHQQRATLEEMLPHLQPGGVYLCEDVHGARNRFGAYVSGLAQNLNTGRGSEVNTTKWPTASTVWGPTPFQRSIHSVHLYPFVAVIERSERPVSEFVSLKQGTQWQPYLDAKDRPGDGGRGSPA
jgi:hypothetical protein